VIPVDNDDEDGKYVNMQKNMMTSVSYVMLLFLDCLLLKLLLQIIGVFILS